MFGNGNVGKHLDVDRNDVNAYFSRDAGNTWEEVATGSWVPEFGDSGGIVIMAQPEIESHIIRYFSSFYFFAHASIRYSLDEGNNWQECSFSDQDMLVENIRVDALWASRSFILYGTRGNDVVLVSLDFTNTLQTPCTAHELLSSCIINFFLRSR